MDDIKWHCEIVDKSILYNDLSTLKFVFSQSEQSLKEVLAITDSIATRAYTLISLVVAIVVAIIGFIASKFDTFYQNLPLNISSLIGIIYFLYILNILKKNVLPTAYYTTGNQPKFMLINELFTENVDANDRISHLYISEIEQYQDKIEYGTIANSKRQSSLRKSIQLLFWFPIVFIALYLSLFYLLPIVACH